MMKKLLPFLILVSLLSLIPTVQSSVEVDAIDVVSWVIDGDTFDVASGDRIRLADIDAPEEGERGYHNAKNFLNGLVLDKTVYLDIDDIHRTDTLGKRLVCVVYISHNSTHFKNVNKALLAEGFAVIDNHDNEFNPYSWSLYYPKNEGPESLLPTAELYVITIGIIVVGIIVFALSRRKETFVASRIPS